LSFSKTPAFSKANHIRPFSDKADGMLIGEGLGMLVLKRLEDAERDGDTIYALIKGVGTSSDGRFKSVYAPRPSGQAMAMNRAYEEAGFEA
jgi:acyl transferase domain-containing protein